MRFRGRVRHGDKRGRSIGFPTLNLRVPQHVALRKGVYAVKVMGLAEQPLNAVANLGVRPTVHGLGKPFRSACVRLPAKRLRAAYSSWNRYNFLRDEMKLCLL